MQPDRFLNDDRPLKVQFRGETRCASWQYTDGEVHVHAARSSRRVKFRAKDHAAAKRKAEALFLEILKETVH